MLERMKPIARCPRTQRCTGFTFPDARGAVAADHRHRGRRGRLRRPRRCCTTSTCASTRTTASRCWAATARASRRSPSCCPTGSQPMRGRKIALATSCASATSPSTRSTSCTSTRPRSQHIRRLRPDEAPGQAARPARRRSASAPIRPRPRSGGSRAARRRGCRCCSPRIDAPHLLILDEPTNHLDIESREALVEALTDYTGAVILVSHDMHLCRLVADRLWLVKDGRVAALRRRPRGLPRDAARRPTSPPRRPQKPKAPAARRRDAMLALKAEVRKLRGAARQDQRDARPAGQEARRPGALRGRAGGASSRPGTASMPR